MNDTSNPSSAEPRDDDAVAAQVDAQPPLTLLGAPLHLGGRNLSLALLAPFGTVLIERIG